MGEQLLAQREQVSRMLQEELALVLEAELSLAVRSASSLLPVALRAPDDELSSSSLSAYQLANRVLYSTRNVLVRAHIHNLFQ